MTIMHFILLYGTVSVLLVGRISSGRVLSEATNISRVLDARKMLKLGLEERGTHGPYISNQYISHATYNNDDAKKLDEKLEGVDDRLTRLIALLILQKKSSSPVIQKYDTITKMEEKLKRVEDRLTKLSGDSLQNRRFMPLISNIDTAASSCKEIYAKNRTQENKAYLLRTGYGILPVYCHMTSSGIGACGGGGWTLVMKIDGEKPTFRYESKYWGNKEHYNVKGGRTGFDRRETKLPTYWNTPFSKICLGMKIGHQIKFIVINMHSNSLHSLIAHGNYRNITLGSDTWKVLIGSTASLQTTCLKEGLNVDYYHSKARIGVVGSKTKNCNGYSRIGLGTGGYPKDDTNTCGNVDKEDGKYMKAMGYILVQ